MAVVQGKMQSQESGAVDSYCSNPGSMLHLNDDGGVEGKRRQLHMYYPKALAPYTEALQHDEQTQGRTFTKRKIREKSVYLAQATMGLAG